MLFNANNMRVMSTSLNRGSAILVILLLASNIPVLNTQAENDFPATLSVDLEDGTVIDDEFIFKALVMDELEPHSASWELLDSTSTRHYVSVSEFHQGVTSGPVTEWTFDIVISPETVGLCSCILVVSITDSNGSISESASIFIKSYLLPMSFYLQPCIYMKVDGSLAQRIIYARSIIFDYR